MWRRESGTDPPSKRKEWSGRLARFECSPWKSARRCYSGHEGTRTSVGRVFRSLHAQNEDNFDRRTEFCDWLLGKEAEAGYMNGIVWSGQATFKLNRCINWHDSV
jgi:hypothetical protein